MDTENVITDLQEKVFVISLNREHRNNAFDDKVLKDLLVAFDQAESTDDAKVILLNARGRHFSAGADLGWMQRMASFSEEENFADAQVLAKLMHTIYKTKKPTIVAVQGAAYGGGVGLAAACDIVIAAQSARFCFSEVKLGLIPAVISPYVIRAVGERLAKWLFISGDVFNAEQARLYNLVHLCVNDDELNSFSLDYAHQLSQLPREALLSCKALVTEVAGKEIDEELMKKTAALIAEKRVSLEGQQGLKAFLRRDKSQ